MKICGVKFLMIVASVHSILFCVPTPSNSIKKPTAPAVSPRFESEKKKGPEEKGEWKKSIDDFAEQVRLLRLSFNDKDPQKQSFIERVRYHDESMKGRSGQAHVESVDTDKLFFEEQKRLYNKYSTEYNQLLREMGEDEKDPVYSRQLFSIKRNLQVINKYVNDHTREKTPSSISRLQKKIDDLLRDLKVVGSESELDNLYTTYQSIKNEYEAVAKRGTIPASISGDLQRIGSMIGKEKIDFIMNDVDKAVKSAESLWNSREVGVNFLDDRLKDLKKTGVDLQIKMSTFISQNKDAALKSKIDRIKENLQKINDTIKQVERTINPSADVSSQIKDFLGKNFSSPGGGINEEKIKAMKDAYDNYFKDLGPLENQMTSQEDRAVQERVDSLKESIEKYEGARLQEEIALLKASLLSATSANIQHIQDRYSAIDTRYKTNQRYLSRDINQSVGSQLDELKKEIEKARTRLNLNTARTYGLKGLLYGAGALLAGYYTFNQSSNMSSTTRTFGALFSSVLGFSAFSNLSKWFLPAKKKVSEKREVFEVPAR